MRKYTWQDEMINKMEEVIRKYMIPDSELIKFHVSMICVISEQSRVTPLKFNELSKEMNEFYNKNRKENKEKREEEKPEVGYVRYRPILKKYKIKETKK